MSGRIGSRTTRAKGEAGISLIELLIAIAITGLIVVPIGAAIYFGVRTSGATQTRVTQSNGSNLLASYLVPDVGGATTAGTGVDDSVTCGVGGTVDLMLTTSDIAESVSYFQGTGAKSTVLYRRTCAGGALTGLARVASGLSAAPSFVCDGGNACVQGSVFHSVTVTLTQGAGASAYQSRVEAVRRSS
jgi:Tfp pilus assembly protein PilW